MLFKQWFLSSSSKALRGHHFLPFLNGNSKSFTPLAIVIIEGTLEDNQFKYGHYLAEVKNMETGYWFRTSDASKPKCLAGKELSDLGYLYLFKKD